MSLIRKTKSEQIRTTIIEDTLELARVRGELAKETDPYHSHKLSKYANQLKDELHRYGVEVN